jgi:hypothetical protein
MFVLQLKDFIGGAGEDLCKFERQFQAGHVAVALDGVDALAGDARGLRQLLLRPIAGDAQLLDPVCDRGCHVKPAFHFRVG